MLARRTLLALAAAFAFAGAAHAQGAGPRPNPVVVITTTEGAITVELSADKAPITTANFLKYVDRKLYDGATFYRASKPPGQTTNDYGSVQGGLRDDVKKKLPPVAHESTLKTGLRHTDGTISMGRYAPGTAQADWVICIGDMSYLDATATDPGFAAFGHVTDGMPVARTILGMPTDPNKGVGAMKGEILVKPVKIISIRRAPCRANVCHANAGAGPCDPGAGRLMPVQSRLQVGVDVPWVTSWSTETITGPAPCPSIDGAVAMQQLDRPGRGRPLYSKNHLFRQRKSVREFLCPMCGEPTHEGDRWTQTGQWTTAGEYRAHGLGGWLPAQMADSQALLGLGAVAPLHRACAERSLTQCPHLKGMADKTLKAFPAAWIVAPISVAAKPAHAAALRVYPAPTAVTFLWLIGVP